MSAAERPDSPRTRGTNPRARGTNPRARGTNPHPGKSEARGQWRAAWRRIEQMTPETAHRIRSDFGTYLGASELPQEVRQLAGLLSAHAATP